MRYAKIRKMDVSNGDGLGVSLFVQGCHFHCPQCFNSETWDFNGGQEFTKDVATQFCSLLENPYIKRVSILGGEPLCEENFIIVMLLINHIKLSFPDKKIWIWTGFTLEELLLNYSHLSIFNIFKKIDVLVDGRFEYAKKDLSLKYCGSTNQRVIDIQKTFNRKEIVLWDKKQANNKQII